MLRSRLHGSYYKLCSGYMMRDFLFSFSFTLSYFISRKFCMNFFAQNMEKSAKAINNNDLRASFSADLNSLSNAGLQDSFYKVVILFKKKWASSSALALCHLERLTGRLSRFYRGTADIRGIRYE